MANQAGGLPHQVGAHQPVEPPVQAPTEDLESAVGEPAGTHVALEEAVEQDVPKACGRPREEGCGGGVRCPHGRVGSARGARDATTQCMARAGQSGQSRGRSARCWVEGGGTTEEGQGGGRAYGPGQTAGPSQRPRTTRTTAGWHAPPSPGASAVSTALMAHTMVRWAHRRRSASRAAHPAQRLVPPADAVGLLQSLQARPHTEVLALERRVGPWWRAAAEQRLLRLGARSQVGVQRHDPLGLEMARQDTGLQQHAAPARRPVPDLSELTPVLAVEHRHRVIAAPVTLPVSTKRPAKFWVLQLLL